MKTHGYRLTPLLLCAMLGAGVLTTSCMTTPAPAPAATQSLLDTRWRLTKLGDEVIENPVGERAVHFQLQAANSGLTGFSGCNRMFGGYLLNADELRFDQVGATKMACLDEPRMKLEQEYFDMLSAVSRWKISGSLLELQDASGAKLATFAAAPPEQ